MRWNLTWRDTGFRRDNLSQEHFSSDSFAAIINRTVVIIVRVYHRRSEATQN